MEKLALSVTEASQILGISRSHLYYLINHNKFPYLQIGNRKVIPTIELEAWIKEHTIK